jgi:uncharacterized protein YneF (UPF0154 family)
MTDIIVILLIVSAAILAAIVIVGFFSVRRFIQKSILKKYEDQ